MASSPIFWVAALGCLAVLAVLAFGIATFVRGGEFNRKNANKIMRLRLILQFVAVIAILLTFTFFQRGG